MGRAPTRAELLLLAASCVVALALGEAVVRLAGLAAERPTGYAPVNTIGRAGGPANALGYRDLERTPAKPPGARRLVCLGDSFTWGEGVEFEDTYPRRLERALTRRRRERWEAVNLALRGMNTADEAARFVDVGAAYGPDVVLLGYCLNDAESEESALARWATPEPARPNTGRLRLLLDRSVLVRFARRRAEVTLAERRRVAYYRALFADEAPGWRASREALRLLGASCRERRVPWVVAIFPLFGNPLEAGYPFAGLHAEVARAASEAGASVVDLLPAYRGLRWELLVVDRGDEHPNEIAHRIAADTLLKALDGVVPLSRAAPSRTGR